VREVRQQVKAGPPKEKYGREPKKRLRILDLHREGLTPREIAPAAKASVGYVRHVLSDARLTSNIPPQEEQPVEEAVDADIQAERERLESERIKKQYAALVKQRAADEMLVDAFRDAIVPLPQVKVYKRRASREESGGKHVAVAMLSDTHAGEVVKAEAVGGLGGYDWQTFRERLGLWTQVVIDLTTDKRRGGQKLDELVFLMDGDMVSGEIHDDAAGTNELSPIAASAATAQLLSHSVAQLSRHFDNILVSCTVGNHGRMDRKPRHKEAVERNWDWLTYQQTRQHLLNQEHVTFHIPKAKYAITNVLGTRILHMHGDGIPSWLNFPYYGIDRVTKRLRETLLPADQHFDVVCMGHFHASTKLPTPVGPIYINGSFPGVTEFALNKMHSALPPTQWLLTVHEKHGVVKGEEIFLDRAVPEDAKGFPDGLAEVW